MFDTKNIILRFGVMSDVHVSGSWNQPRSVAKLRHAIKAFDAAADGKLDALLVNGDLVDAVNSIGNVNRGFERYGNKLAQNVREVGYVGAAFADRIAKPDDMQIFYALGNHDESGRGRTGYNPDRAGYPSMHSAAIFAALFCGWECRDFEETNTEFEEYFADLTALAAGSGDAAAFTAKYGVDAEKALTLYRRHYGRDETPADLMDGNRHMVLGGVHFCALETSCAPETAQWFEAICKQSVDEDPKKPIFAITHYRMRDTIFISEDGITRLDAVLAKYPQVVIWAGHTHTPLFLETAIDQSRGFTAVDSAVVAYQSNTALLNEHGEKAFPFNLPTKESHNFGNGCYVEVDAQYNVRIHRLDLYRSCSADYAKEEMYRGIGIYDDFEALSGCKPTDGAVFIREAWEIGGFDKPDEFALTRARADKLALPAFAEGTELLAHDGVIEFDAAHSDDMIFAYRVELYGAGCSHIYRLTTNPHLYTAVADMPTHIVQPLDVHGKFKARVFAIDVWQRESVPLEAAVEL